MSFAHSGMAWESLCTKQFCTDGAMTDIWFGTKALDAGCVTTENADVVEHGGFFQELAIHVQFWFLPSNGKRALSHLSAVQKQQVLQLGVVSVVFMDEGKEVHEAGQGREERETEAF